VSMGTARKGGPFFYALDQPAWVNSAL
jgi:hypothetical protein